MTKSSIKVGVIADQTGALSFMGVANANVTIHLARIMHCGVAGVA